MLQVTHYWHQQPVNHFLVTPPTHANDLSQKLLIQFARRMSHRIPPQLRAVPGFQQPLLKLRILQIQNHRIEVDHHAVVGAQQRIVGRFQLVAKPQHALA